MVCSISDLGPFRAGRADVLRRLELEETTYGWAVEMILKGAFAGFRIVEVPVSYYPRIGKSKISGTVRGTVGAGWFILSLIVRYYFRHPGPGRNGRLESWNSDLLWNPPAEHTTHPRDGRRTLVVMAKAPRPGTVKTRLAAEPSSRSGHRALSLPVGRHDGVGALVGHGGGCDDVPCFGCRRTDAPGRGVSAVWWRRKGQGPRGGPDLGVCAFRGAWRAARRRLQQRQPASAAICFGVAFEALVARDLVVGPTHDGGYYLVGAKAAHPGFSKATAWAPRARLTSCWRAPAAWSLRWASPMPFYDIDVASDLTAAGRGTAARSGPGATNSGLAATVGDRRWRRCRRARESCEAHAIPQAVRAWRHSACGADDLLAQLRRHGRTVVHGSAGRRWRGVSAGHP